MQSIPTLQPLVAGNIGNISRSVDYIRKDHILTALNKARELGPRFGIREQQWAGRCFVPLERASETFLELTVKKKVDIETAKAARDGLLLGGAVIRAITDEGLANLERCRDNMLSWGIMARGIAYDGRDLDQASLSRILGAEAAAGIKEIHYPAAQTLCGSVVVLSLLPAQASAVAS